MKKIVLTILISSLFGLPNVSGQSFKDVFVKALAEKNLAEAKEILLAWDYEDRNDPELYPSYFNYYTLKSQEKDSLSYDKKYADSALYYISEGINMFPTRLDMRVAKIYMLSKLNEFDVLTDETLQLIEYSKKIGNNWKGENFKLVDIPQTVIEGAVQDFQEILFAEKDTTLFDNIRKISESMAKHYPGYEQSWINISTLHAINKEYDKSLEALKKAEKINPKNPFLLYNMAYVYKIKGDKTNAEKYFRLTISHVDNNKEIKLKQAAEEQLKQL
jgi:tetratricopeptide (TPR) repeat protein